MKKGWELIQSKLRLDEPTTLGDYLGCGQNPISVSERTVRETLQDVSPLVSDAYRTNSKGSFNLLDEALWTKLGEEFQLGTVDVLCAQGSWDIAMQLARRTCVAAEVQLQPELTPHQLCELLDKSRRRQHR